MPSARDTQNGALGWLLSWMREDKGNGRGLAVDPEYKGLAYQEVKVGFRA